MIRLQSRFRIGRLAIAAGVAACVVFALLGWRPLYVTWQIRTARAALRLGDQQRVSAAVRRLKDAQGIERPDRPELLYLLGRAQRRAGKVDEALDCLRRAEAAGWHAGDVREQLQLALIQRARFEDTERFMNELLTRNASDELAYEAYEAMAKGYLYAYRFNDALHCLDFWIEWCPQAADPRIWRAGIWEQVRRWERANSEYREILRINPDHLEARLALARVLLVQLNQATEAQREFQHCLSQSPDDSHALLGLAMCERQLADPLQAERRLRALLNRDLAPDQRTTVQLELGQVLLERRELPEATRRLEDAVEADPLNSTAQYTLGLAYSAGGHRDRAAARFERSRLLTDQFNRLTDITAELVSHPDQPDLRWEAGKIMMDRGLYLEGAAWMSTVLMYDPGHRQTHESLARYYETIKKDSRLAEYHWAQARRAADERHDHSVSADAHGDP